MVRFVNEEDKKEIAENIGVIDCHVIFAAKFGDDFISISFTLNAPEELEGDELRDYLEPLGKKIIAGILTPEAMKKEWSLDEID